MRSSDHGVQGVRAETATAPGTIGDLRTISPVGGISNGFNDVDSGVRPEGNGTQRSSNGANHGETNGHQGPSQSDLGGVGGFDGGNDARRSRRIPPKLYRIGEVIDYSGLSRQTIHNYTTMGLLRESQWTRGGHRLYDESVFDRLDHVLSMKQQHKSMREIREHFSRLDQLR